MSSIGAIAPNFHEGTRSEYLAQYVFSAFGTSVPVPHPEDSGIDLYCTLGERIGRRLHIQNYYLVQIKSAKKPVVYPGVKSVEWLLSHRYPFFICYIDKMKGEIELYQTVILTSCFFKSGVNSITISTDARENPFKNVEPQRDITLCVGPPILQFKITDMQDQDWTNKAHGVLRSWIDLAQENINQKALGLNFFRVPEKYITNAIFSEPKSFIGNFKLDETHQQYFYEVLLKLLSQLANQFAAEKDRVRFKLLADFVGVFVSSSALHDSWGIWLLATSINTGAKYLNLPMKIELTSADGKKQAPILDIAG